MGPTTINPKSTLPGPPHTLGPTFTRPLSLLNPLDYIRLLYWIFFHTERLSEYVTWLAPDYPIRPRPGETRELLKSNVGVRALVVQSFLLTFILPYAILYLLEIVGVPVKYGYVAVNVAVGAAFGVPVGVAMGVLYSVAGGMAFGVAVGTAFGVFGI